MPPTKGTPMAVKTLTLSIDGHTVGTADIYTDSRGVPGAVIDKDGSVLVPINARLTGSTAQAPSPANG